MPGWTGTNSFFCDRLRNWASHCGLGVEIKFAYVHFKEQFGQILCVVEREGVLEDDSKWMSTFITPFCMNFV